MMMRRTLLLVAPLLATAAALNATTDEVCTTEEQLAPMEGRSLQGSALLQKQNLRYTTISTELGDLSSEENARFLMQATFGPTLDDLKALDRVSMQQWVLDQMKIPSESHREFYRARVNPPSFPDEQPRFLARGPCAQGSRWQGFAFTRMDIKQSVDVQGGRVRVAGKWRTDLNPAAAPAACTDKPHPSWSTWRRGQCPQQKGLLRGLCRNGGSDWTAAKYCQKTCFDLGSGYPGDDCSGGLKDFKGFLCSVQEEAVGGTVVLSRSSKCSQPWLYHANPATWASDASQALETSLPFESVPSLPGTLFLKRSQRSDCELANPALIRFRGSFYAPSPRMELVQNTVDSPAQAMPGGCVPLSFANEAGCRLLRADAACPVACGSPGEVASLPTLGHQLPMVTQMTGNGVRAYIRQVDNAYLRGVSANLAKSAVWIQKAMGAKDQLRQRMAWALSQIIVTAVPGIKSGSLYTELWENFYDIFVSNAFGNLRDILRAVTYSPLMGEYLTYEGSRSYDADGAWPDENYAREIMQLFTIGLVKLHPNGTVATDDKGVDVPSYGNEDIMNLARVFTGFVRQRERSNIEHTKGGNKIDPMRMIGKYHDRYPKPDLHGGYLGDGYPLCSDLPPLSFLAKGARYEFLGYAFQGQALSLQKSSGLYKALRTADGKTGLRPVVVLAGTLACSHDECGASVPLVVKAGPAFYEYVAPPCVHPFLASGRFTAWGTNYGNQQCTDLDTGRAAVSCCNGGCSDNPTKGMMRQKITCENAETKWLRKGKPLMTTRFCNKNKGWRKNKFCAMSCWKAGLGYAGDNCSSGLLYKESKTCDSTVPLIEAEKACRSQGLSLCPHKLKQRTQQCRGWVWTPTPCSPRIRVHEDGKVSAHTKHHEQNKFEVFWLQDSAAPADEHAIDVVTRPVFRNVPTEDALLERLKIGAFAPDRPCTHGCDGRVKAYASPEGIYSVDTVFALNGRFFRNLESLVQVGARAFRTPPVFIRPGTSDEGVLSRAALEEVESLLDHLFHHPNTPVFICKRLIQRFVSSNPSAAYVLAVTEAFRKGTFDGQGFSGRYGDLGATVAAILLHPEAKAQGPADGLLREPLLKMMHFLRAMGYKEEESRGLTIVDELQARIGQFPFSSPTVFNFYDADFMPPSLKKPEPEPEPEAEPEPLVAPEFEIFTPPAAMHFLNGMFSLVDEGVSSFNDGFGYWDARALKDPRGSFGFKQAASEDQTLDQLSLLLTGGRLTPHNAEVVRRAYRNASKGGGIKAAQKAILLTPEFHNYGEARPNGTRPKQGVPPAGRVKDYKATVMLFLAGGADTFHMLVPLNCPLHDEYAKVRKGIEHNQKDLHHITTRTQTCGDFGVHPKMPYVANLYRTGRAAFVSNVGALIEPLNRTTFKRGGRRCLGMFSHSHQQTAAKTLQCQVPGSAPMGAGGRIADVLAASDYKTTSFSVAGTSTWSVGFDTHAEIIDRRDGAVRFKKYEIWADSIDNITAQRHGNVYCEEYAKSFAEAVASSESLGKVLDKVKLKTDYKAENTLSSQLMQVARLIATREDRKAERDFFYVQLGGFDTHKDMVTVLNEKFPVIDEALKGFVQELEKQKVFDSVVLVTESDFGRTLTKNGGAGTDHGWGGNHLILGGGVSGGEIFNRYPDTLLEGSDFDAGRGRVIPRYPWESMMVPIAEWMGIKDVEAVFPNLKNFNRAEHIISRSALFKGAATE